MRDRLRDLLRIEYLRRAMRDKTVRAVTEAIEPMQRRLDELEHEVVALRATTEKAAEQSQQAANSILDRVVEFEIRTRRDIVYAADLEVATDSARFAEEHMPNVARFGDPHDTLRHALANTPDTGGLALEFGVYTGGTLRIIAEQRSGDVYGFDSFEGLPEDWRTGFPAGTFTVDGLPDVPGAELVSGWFDQTLPEFLASHPGHVDFLHVDGDLYSSAKTVLELVGPRLRAGSIVVFDEFFNFPGWREHEYRAWTEYVANTGTEFSYLAYTYCHEQVVVRIDRVPDTAPKPKPEPGADR